MTIPGKRKNGVRFFWLSLAVQAWAGAAAAGTVSIHPSNRYYQDGDGRPLFLIGYYGWAAVPDGSFIDHPSRYSTMIQQGAPYKINYIRISLGVNRFTSQTTPQSWNNQPTPVPFAHVGGKANLDQWDSSFWSGLQNQCALAQRDGVMVMVSLFDGVEIRQNGGAAYGYANSFWNPANQSAGFYPDPDSNHNGQIDDPGEFYQTAAFTASTGLGKYQRLLIARAVAQTAAFTNVCFEVGNELGGSDAGWNTAVIGYVKSLTSKPVTQEGNSVCGSAACGRTGNLDGWSEHVANTPAQVKANVAQIVGRGVPAWEDPDGPALSAADVSPDDLRRAAWYSFAGGAAGWGGFTVDYWSFGHGFNDATACYYRSLQSFIEDSGVQFWDMVPSHNLVKNSAANSCLARTGEYVAYVLRDASVTVDLTGSTGSLPYRLYDPRTNAWGAAQAVSGGGVRTFTRPSGADDWVIYIGPGAGTFAGGACPGTQEAWSALGTQQILGDGITPGVATDAQGNIHVVFMNNGAIRYRKAGVAGVFGAAESIPAPAGAANYNSPHVVCDADGDPHLVFERDWYPSASKCWYTNRKGGTWKPPVLVFNGLLVLYARLALQGSNAFVVASTAEPAGTLARLSNLGGTPHVDLTAGTYLFAPYPVIDGAGKLFVAGRNSASGHYLQQYDRNLNAIGAGVKVSTGTPNKTGEPTAAVIDGTNLIHVIGNCGATGIDPESTSDIWYNQSRDGGAPIRGSVLGLTGPGWMGQVVYPHAALDAGGRIYLAYRNEATGEGEISTVNGNQFAAPVTFAPAITDPNTAEQRRWNCQLAPASGGGVYVTWDYGGKCYIRSVGVTVRQVNTLRIKPACDLAIDGDPSDWDLADFTAPVRGGQGGSGDTALVGYDGGHLYYAGYFTGGSLPADAADHTARVYGRHDAEFLYFLARSDDSDVETPNPAGMNWSNDCVEIYLDPGNDRGSTPPSNSSSDVQIVIDAANQKNVYGTTAAYASQVLDGITSAVAKDATGWWLELRISKTALNPQLPAEGGTFGLDFNFRDNDNDDDPTQTTVYTWSDASSGAGFPSKIPDRWGIAETEPLEVWIDLGAPDPLAGITHPQNADGNTTASTTGGRPCRRNVNPSVDLYFYFNVSDAFAFASSRPDLYVVMDYFDAGTGSLALHYDSDTGDTLPAFYKDGGSVALRGSNKWKQKTFHLADAYFGNRQNAGADFRIAKSGGGYFYLGLIQVLENSCPGEPICGRSGDTHCGGLQVQGPAGGVAGTYTASATAADDSGDPISYTFSAMRGDEAPVVVGPQAGRTASFDLGPGSWTITVDVDDDPRCPDVAADARCSTAVEVRQPDDRMVPGDANGDGRLDISDAVAMLGVLFLGSPSGFPCGDGRGGHPANVSLMDWQPDGAVDISDGVGLLAYLFLAGAPHFLGSACTPIAGCPDGCR